MQGIVERKGSPGREKEIAASKAPNQTDAGTRAPKQIDPDINKSKYELDDGQPLEVDPD